jgi:uncharacterized protein (TIGR02452 family)
MSYFREDLAKIAEHTMGIIKDQKYTLNGKDFISIKEAADRALVRSVLYTPETYLEVASVNEFKTNIITTQETTLEAGKRLRENGYENVLALNFASARHPGGGFLTGATAQEESLARSSSLYPCIAQMNKMYDYNSWQANPLYSDYMIYSPHVPVFKNDAGKLLVPYYTLSFITSPAPNLGVIQKNAPQDEYKVNGVMRMRIARILKVALFHGYEALVLGAFGCGVFKNDPAIVAGIFKECLEAPAFKNQFKQIVFAVYDPSPSKSTFYAFNKVF